MNATRILTAGILVIFAILVAGTSLAFGPSANHLEDPLLTRLAIRPSQLPEGSEWIVSGPVGMYDVTQPLHASNIPLVKVDTGVLEYKTAYRVEAFVPNGQSSIYIGNYLYRYASERQAQQAAARLIDVVLAQDGSQYLGEFKSPNQKGLHGQAVMFIGDEEDAIHWFVGSKGEVLVLLMANNMLTANSVPDPSAQETFKTLIDALLQE